MKIYPITASMMALILAACASNSGLVENKLDPGTAVTINYDYRTSNPCSLSPKMGKLQRRVIASEQDSKTNLDQSPSTELI